MGSCHQVMRMRPETWVIYSSIRIYSFKYHMYVNPNVNELAKMNWYSIAYWSCANEVGEFAGVARCLCHLANGHVLPLAVL
jgi:hypothetical protein